MRPALVLLVLLLSACGNTTGDGRRTATIDKSYKARDACLARNASADDISNSDPDSLAHAIALACLPETEQLVSAANRDGDAKVAAAIRQDSEFRARGYILKVRGQLIF
jgi:hypothetical protein